jgi:hypothetical protein
MPDQPITAELASAGSAPSSSSANRKVGYAAAGCLGLALLLGVGVLGAFGYGVWHVVQAAQMESHRALAVDAALKSELARHDVASPERAADLVAGFAADEVGVSEEELATLQQLFDNVYERRQLPANDAKIAKVFDFETFKTRVLAWPQGAALDPLEKLQAVANLGESKPLSWLRSGFTIVHAKRQGDGKSLVVYGYMGIEDELAEQRWLVVPHGDTWRIADAEICDWGRWRSQLQAQHLQAAFDTPDTSTRFEAQLERLQSANELAAEGNNAAAVAVVNHLSYDGLNDMLHDELRMRALQAANPFADAKTRLALAEGFRQPEQWPGVAFVTAQANAELGNWEAALQAAETYKRQVGATLGINHILLPYYQQQNDAAACAAIHRQWLRVEPESTDALAGLAESSLDGGAEVIARLKQCADPAAKAVAVIRAISAEKQNAVDPLVAFLEQQQSAQSLLQEVKADLAFNDGDYATAAAHYLALWRERADDPEASLRVTIRYLVSMVSANQTEEAIGRAVDPLMMLQFLGDSYFGQGEYVVTASQMRAAVEKCRTHYPDDLHVLAFDGYLLVEAEEYVAAEKPLQAAFKKLAKQAAEESEESFEGLGNPIDPTEVRVQLAIAMLHQGRVEQARRLVAETQPDGEEVGILLAFQALDLQNKVQRSLGQQLFERHRSVAPNDPMIPVMQALLLEAKGETVEAWQVTRTVALPGDDPRSASVRELAIRLLASEKVPLASYNDLSPGGPLFNDLAERLASQKQWDRLTELVVLERRTNADNKRLDEWQTRALYGQESYEELVQKFLPQAAKLAQLKEVEAYVSSPDLSLERVIRSLVKLKRYEEALALAREHKQVLPDEWWPVAIHLAQGNAEQALAAVPSGPYAVAGIYDDAEFAPLALAPAARPLRDKAPPYAAVHANRVDMLLSEPLVWDDATLTKLVQATLGDEASVEPLAGVEPPEGVQLWKLAAAGQTYLVARGRGPAASAQRFPPHPTKKVVEAIAKHQAWLTIAVLQQSQFEPLPPPVYPLVEALAGEQALLLWDGPQSELIVISEEVRTALRSSQRDQLRRSRWNTYEPLVRSTDAKTASLPDSKWRTFAPHVSASPGSSRVCLLLDLAGRRHEIWFRVDRLVEAEGTHPVFVVSLGEPSPLLPNLNAGEPYRVLASELHDFEYTTDGVVHRGRP